MGSFPPNGYGLYDMTRNVAEWVHDWYAATTYESGRRESPRGPWHGSFKVIRGGGWHTGPYGSRVCYRSGRKSNWVDFNIGFRCARSQGVSAALRVEEVILSDGVNAALEEYERMRARPPGEYDFDPFELNEMGYRLVAAERVRDARAVFERIVAAYPDSFNAHDSLAEACALLGDRQPAIAEYRRAIELHPRCRTSHEGLQKLEAEEPSR
ncbi:MAG: SUMF1/EgtB/PvdO family nonheme iron enzyme [Candidatus Eisenbacteria bacterium]|nr:SUMF1/EgtB/PvdO family nonheme iron enzyme [Candidatus Eisenbacteria bacterium]